MNRSHPRKSSLHKLLAALPLAVLVAACASGPMAKTATVTPEVDIAQLRNGTELFRVRGPVPLDFALHVKNPLSVPVTLKRVELRSTGPGGYRLNAEALALNRTIPAGGEETFQLSTWGRARGGTFSRLEPVTLVGTAFFDTPEGRVVKIFTEYVPQPA